DREQRASEEFTYDLAGNIAATRERLRDVARGATFKVTATTRFYSRDGRLERVGDTEYIWDADGRLAEKREGSRKWRYEWSAEGRLKGLQEPDGQRWRYDYDAFGRRLKK